MARSHSHVLSRPAGFALLKPASKPQLDAARIATLSGTIAVNLFALGMLMLPLTLPDPVVWQEPSPEPNTRFIKRDPPIAQIVPLRTPTERTPPRPAQRSTVAPAPSQATASPVLSETGTELAVESSVVDTGPTESIVPVVSAPAAVQLEYIAAPAPKYPRGAQMRRISGTVLLQVLVGVDGKPIEVSIAQSSGNRELDDAARQQVLKRWSFRPATKAGMAIQAIGLVPIEFALKN